MTNADIIQKLIEARQKLARGWCQDTARRNNKTCLYASLWGRDHYGEPEVVKALAKTLNPLKPVFLPPDFVMCSASALVLWNDEPGRTQQEVLDLVDRTIASLMLLEATEVVREELVEAFSGLERVVRDEELVEA